MNNLLLTCNKNERTEIYKYSLYIHIVPKEITTYDHDKYYVGITSQSVKNRWMNGLGYKNQMFYRAVQKYSWNNIKHIILCQYLTQENAERLEKEVISYLKANIPEYGYNIASGGLTGGGGHRKIAQYDFNGILIKTFPSIHDAAVEITNNQDAESSGVIWALSQIGRSWHGYMWRYYKDYPLYKIEPYKEYDCTVKILQYDIKGNFIKKWNSLKEVSDYYHTYGISNACRKLAPTAVGYQWKYETDESEITDISDKTSTKTIYVYDINGNFINEYNSISDAVRQLNIPVKRKCINLGSCYKDISHNYAHGYRWCEEYYETLPPLRIRGKIVAQIDGDSNEILNLFKNVPDAVKNSVDSASSIYRSTNKHNKTQNNYYWEYIENIKNPVFSNDDIKEKYIAYTGFSA